MWKIKYCILVVVAFLATTTFSFAQTYTISPNDTVLINSTLEDLETLSISQVNNSNDTLNLRWQKVSESVPALWEASICDNLICNTSLVDSGSMNPIYPTDYGFLLLHITAHINFGTAIIRYAVWDVNTPNLRDTLTFILNVTTTGIETANSEQPTIYFGARKIYLQNINTNYTSLLINDLSGKEVFKTKIYTNTEIDVPILPTSIYLIQLIGKQKQFQQKIFINE